MSEWSKSPFSENKVIMVLIDTWPGSHKLANLCAWYNTRRFSCIVWCRELSTQPLNSCFPLIAGSRANNVPTKPIQNCFVLILAWVHKIWEEYKPTFLPCEWHSSKHQWISLKAGYKQNQWCICYFLGITPALGLFCLSSLFLPLRKLGTYWTTVWVVSSLDGEKRKILAN